jgi:hypothetical protein
MNTLQISDELSLAFGGKRKVFHEIVFVVTEYSQSFLVTSSPDLSWMVDGETPSMQNILGWKEAEKLPEEIGLYKAELEVYSYQSNRYDDPVEYDYNTTIREIELIKIL